MNYLIISQESSCPGVLSSLSPSVGRSIEAVVVGLGQGEALAVEGESEDQLLLVEAAVQPDLNGVFLEW